MISIKEIIESKRYLYDMLFILFYLYAVDHIKILFNKFYYSIHNIVTFENEVNKIFIKFYINKI